MVVTCHGLYSSQQVNVLKNAMSVAICNNERILIGEFDTIQSMKDRYTILYCLCDCNRTGGEDCLYLLDIVEEGLFQFSDKDVKRVSQLKVLADEGLVVLLAGKTNIKRK